jgi:ATP citrate (pro-S)-lyase
LEAIIKATYERLVEKKVVVPVEDYTLPPVPEDLNSAIKSGKVQAPTHIVSTICDDRGEEQSYAGVAMSTIIDKDYGVGDVISLLWFKWSLPRYCTKLIKVISVLLFSLHCQKPRMKFCVQM